MTREVIDRWTSLAWSGTPNYEGALVEWPSYIGSNEVVLNFTEAGGITETIEPYREEQCDFMRDQIGLVYGLQ
ncbi:hypothetical protein SERLA73DRAFT_175527 [Serpula lacrymans var. lacrymans S7.3]|uniref:Carboxylesterase type B domain-containing protein n=2 Tax=Serpula lacrymans var. lacrymans TaxID=341189 RepID=F8PKD3_SERL3|nr:uncharacterized protein SERLADRAFT_458019 [Serpula lacrymans var. lacrymans S7.9]EGO03847.1 hypothetical protein SERLA73DRAFT_175527 [Serpula lacrymans var. lacrymans S7.3]EGO29773.1 hypothetical protein SERLADRAFT_458019 [Serpula lacrymans var. lacrymans S7.9]